MSIYQMVDLLGRVLGGVFTSTASKHQSSGIITYGGEKKGGGHIHTENRGEDRTPAQKAGDKKRRGPRKPKVNT